MGSFENWELGVLGGSFLDEGVFVNMKYFLMSSQEENPMSIAAGLERLGSNTDVTSYLVASKRLDGGFHLHFGFKSYFIDGLSAGVMFGTEYFVSDAAAILADVSSQQDMTYVVNVGAKLYFENDVVLRLFVVDLTKNKAAKETTYNLGVSINKYM